MDVPVVFRAHLSFHQYGADIGAIRCMGKHVITRELGGWILTPFFCSILLGDTKICLYTLFEEQVAVVFYRRIILLRCWPNDQWTVQRLILSVPRRPLDSYETLVVSASVGCPAPCPDDTKNPSGSAVDGTGSFSRLPLYAQTLLRQQDCERNILPVATI